MPNRMKIIKYMTPVNFVCSLSLMFKSICLEYLLELVYGGLGVVAKAQAVDL